MPRPSPMQVSVACQLLERHSLPFHASDYHDQQTELLAEVIERKAKGLPLKQHQSIPSSTTPESEVMDKIRRMLGSDPEKLGSIS